MNSRGSMGANKPKTTSCFSSGWGRLRKRMRSTTLKTAEVEPMPSARVSTATAVNAGLVTSIRNAKRTSCQTDEVIVSWSPVNRQPSLDNSFVAQRLDGIHAHRAPRRKVAGKQAHEGQRHDHNKKCQRIRGGHAVQLSFNNPRQK